MKYICTVDVEAHRGNNPVDDLIYGIINGEQFGLMKILNLLEKYNIKATFFVDFAEVNSWGKESIKKVCNDIIYMNQDVQVHLHPEHFGDKNREELNQYTYDEQKYMIGKCIEYYEEFIGRKPIAFRAGKFSANEDTLKVLNYYDMKIDSSYVKNNVWSKLNNIFVSTNKIESYERLYEIPITMFKERFFNIEGTKFDKYYPLDFNAVTLAEFKRIVDYHKKNGEMTLLSLMHSFSFIKRYGDDLNLKANKSEVRLFENFFELINDDESIESINLCEYLECIDHNQLSGETFIKSYWESFWGIFTRYQKASIRCKQFRKYFVIFYSMLTLLIGAIIWHIWGVIS